MLLSGHKLKAMIPAVTIIAADSQTVFDVHSDPPLSGFVVFFGAVVASGAFAAGV